MSPKRNESLELYEDDIAYLKEMVVKYNLADIGKAVRCLVNHAKEKAEQEKDIFDTIRCHHC
ncbi:hypothetical protein K2X85_01800 [bacterium]|nr:hypothetical protein [bacterium]